MINKIILLNGCMWHLMIEHPDAASTMIVRPTLAVKYSTSPLSDCTTVKLDCYEIDFSMEIIDSAYAGGDRETECLSTQADDSWSLLHLHYLY